VAQLPDAIHQPHTEGILIKMEMTISPPGDGGLEHATTPTPEPDLGHRRYQRAFHIRGNWYGQVKYRADESCRFHKILPNYMDGMTVLDVGACYGVFCYEAAGRGASTVVAVDCDPEAVALVQSVRDYYRLPITTVEMAIEAEPPPVLGDKPRYDLALLLNILHHVGKLPGPLHRPDAVLRSVLKVCNAAVIETPPIMGARWPSWIHDVAAGEGFVVTADEQASHLPEQRRLFKLSRVVEEGHL
jgi:2-polyprenyl-3-methyl-5-hydroxy-6-metoxy-1,4-benzoquinol methylase